MLSPPQSPLVFVGRLGRKKESAPGTIGRGKSFPCAFYFFDYCYFLRDTQRKPLRRREFLMEKSIFIDNSTECGGVFEQLARYTMRYIQLTPDNSNPR